MRRVVVTLSSGSLTGLPDALAQSGITVEERPLLRFEPPEDWAPLDQALAELERYQSIAFTSPRAAAAVAARWRDRALRLERGDAALSRPVVWATGPATAAPLGAWLGPARVPEAPAPTGGEGQESGAGESLARAMLTAGAGSPVLHPCGDSHREELADTLRAAAITVHEVVCYRSVLAADEVAVEAAGRADLLVVGSPRVADLLGRVCSPGVRPRLLALGPTTAAASRGRGWPPDAVAGRPSVAEVAAKVVRLLA